MSDLDFARSIYSADTRDACIPVFYYRAAEVVEDGVRRYEDRAYVKILMPGNRLDEVDRAVKEEDKVRWPQHWDAFLKKQEPPTVGTPLSVWSAVSAAERGALVGNNIKTVEQLAELPESDLRAFPPNILKLKQQARLWLANSKDDAVLFKMQKENTDLKARVDALEEALAVAKAAKPKKVKKLESADDSPKRPA